MCVCVQRHPLQYCEEHADDGDLYALVNSKRFSVCRIAFINEQIILHCKVILWLCQLHMCTVQELTVVHQTLCSVNVVVLEGGHVEGRILSLVAEIRGRPTLGGVVLAYVAAGIGGVGLELGQGI